ncbi:ABC transporter substrate-binding protein [Duganella sp. BJB488]|uniref:ABC transporter substrate-binding protein n=1 Tax=Duganella vulcania TaxID=2692166 RepID=A0A845GB79_9BURK|nr:MULTISPECIES: ABC transporter substrate-binding protein [Duganella]MYM90117.1 ABC transporter substrate-binding protein [Duganella vulcania]NVD74652.1 ABC transporter substrate-binding protein [Duganella sp. BJB1802]RFP15335.1 ABC transporter substrate-binding protein [Duganella sp. BJB489]RFP19891.1 ABC transporter substrate-binding protein [Duganella sp. BJB488]RFP38279.1 ABC transporter substrate-binding protein [Duganella sp. BJB480]
MKTSRHLAAALAAAAALTLSAPAAHAAPAPASPWCASGKTVNFAGLNWESARFLTEVMRYVLEQGYGCKTDALPGTSIAMELALARNDIQVFAEEWIGRSTAWNDAAKAGKVMAVGDIIKDSSEGWYVPEYLVKGDARRGIKASAPGLRSVADLPKYKELFMDDEEPDKGRFLNCPSGWTCQGVNTQKLKAYGMGESYVNFRPGTGPALDAAIASAVQRGRPVLFYYWSPTAMMGRYKFIRLDEPAFSQACWETLTTPNNPHPCGTVNPPNRLRVGLSRAFHDADPALAALFEKMNVPVDLLNALLAEREARKLEAPALAVLFLKRQPAIWQAWMPAAVAAHISSTLK